MLETIRKQTKSWLVKGFIGLIVLSFAVWGIGDIFRGGQDPPVAEVGGVKIRGSELQIQYGRTVETLRRLSGGRLDAEQARALGVVDQALDSLITRALMSQQAAAMGLGVADTTVREAIKKSASFRNDAGVFDRFLYEAVLSQYGFTEEAYVASLRGDLAREQMLGSLAAGLIAPTAVVETIRRYRRERRVVSVVTVSTSDVAEVPEPDQVAIEQYYAANNQRFMALEYRRISFVTMRPADLLDEVDVADEDVREEYEYRLDEFTTRHRRDLDQIVFEDEAAASEAFDRLMAGEDFFAVGAALAGKSEGDIKLGVVEPEDLMDEVAEVAFELAVGVIGKPVETPFGWYILRVNDDLPGGTTPFEEVAEALRLELKIERASEATYELSNRFEDERAGGADLEEAGAGLGIDTHALGPVDVRGYGPDGEVVDGLPTVVDFLQRSFASEAGVESELVEAAGNIFYAFRVDEVTPSALKPLDAVRERVVEAWREERKRELAGEIAEALAERAKSTGSLAEAVAERGLEVNRTEGFTRDGRGLELALASTVIEAIFDLEPGAVTGALANGAGRYAVAELVEVVAADETGGGEGPDGLAMRLRSSYETDLLIRYDESLRRKYGVRVYPRRIEAMF
jgi:peptidyl-prolyl cis-trans isomerase D